MPADTLTLSAALTAAQTEEARAAYANVAIEGTSLSEAEVMVIAAEFYASGEPERIAALPPVAGLSYEQIVAAWRQAGLLKC
jgi:hypothetical protein